MIEEIDFVEDTVDKIENKYSFIGVGYCHHEKIDVWEIWHTRANLKNDKDFCDFASGIIAKAYSLGFCNLFIHYSYENDMKFRES